MTSHHIQQLERLLATACEPDSFIFPLPQLQPRYRVRCLVLVIHLAVRTPFDLKIAPIAIDECDCSSGPVAGLVEVLVLRCGVSCGDEGRERGKG